MLTALYQGFHSLVCQRPNALRPDGGAQTAGPKCPAPCGWDDVLYLNQRRRRCCVRCCSSHESHRHTQCRWKLVRHLLLSSLTSSANTARIPVIARSDLRHHKRSHAEFASIAGPYPALPTMGHAYACPSNRSWCLITKICAPTAYFAPARLPGLCKSIKNGVCYIMSILTNFPTLAANLFMSYSKSIYVT